MVSIPNPTKKKSAAPDQENALSTVTPEHIADKQLATIRAQLCLAGGQRLHIANDGIFLVTNPFGYITRFNSFASLQAHAERGAR